MSELNQASGEPGGEGHFGDMENLVSPKRKRILSPHNRAKFNKGFASTHIPHHRDIFDPDIGNGVGQDLLGSENAGHANNPLFAHGRLPETETFLRRPCRSNVSNASKYDSVKKGNMFGGGVESSYSTDDEHGQKQWKCRNGATGAAIDAGSTNDRANFEEAKSGSLRKCSNIDCEADAGAESDFSGVAASLTALSMDKRQSMLFAKHSPLSSPSSSQNSSLNASFVLSPSRSLFGRSGAEQLPVYEARLADSKSPTSRRSRRRSALLPSAENSAGTLSSGHQDQVGRGRKVGEMVASAILNHRGGGASSSSGGSGSRGAPPAHPQSPAQHASHASHLLDSTNSDNHTHIADFQRGSAGAENHSDTDLLYSFRSDGRSGSLSGSGVASRITDESSGSGHKHGAVGYLLAPRTPYTPLASAAGADAHVSNAPPHENVHTSGASRAGACPGSAYMRQGQAPVSRGVLSSQMPAPVHIQGPQVQHAPSGDDWDVGLTLEPSASPVLTPNRPRRVFSRTHGDSCANSQSLSLSQQSHHEAAMGDLGTPVTEVGSPAVLDGLEDLVGEEDDEEGEDEGDRLSPAQVLRSRVLFPSSRAGSLFDDEGGRQEVKNSGEWRGPEQGEHEEDLEVAMFSSGRHAADSELHAASGMKHHLEFKDAASSAGSSGGSGHRQPRGRLHQRIRTYSPFMHDEGPDNSGLGSHDSSFARDEAQEYHLFAQRFMGSPAVGAPGMLMDSAGDTTGTVSDTRSGSGILSLSKSASDDAGARQDAADSACMDTSLGSLSSTSGVGVGRVARPLPDQSAFDGPNLSRSSHANTSASLLDPSFGSPSSARKRRAPQRPGSPGSADGSPAVPPAPPTPLKAAPLWGSPGPLGSPVGHRAAGLRAARILPASVAVPAHAPAAGAGADYTPSPAVKRAALPGSVDTVMSSDSAGSDIVVHRHHSQDSAHAASATAAPFSAEPFTSLSHPHLRAPGLVRQSSLLDTKLLLSQTSEDDRPVTFREDFEEVGLLGSGTFADVFKVRQKIGAPPNAYFAVKKSKTQFASKKGREWLMAEARTMKLLGQHGACAYIVPFVRAWQEDKYFYLQMGYAERGTLAELLLHLALPVRRATGGSSSSSSSSSVGCGGGIASKQSGMDALLPDNTVWHVVHDVCAGLQHIHACGYVHMDIKPANLLISEAGTVQIGDFGMAVPVGSSEDGHEGDTRYMAEELLNNTVRLPSADIFSLGVALYELCCYYPDRDDFSGGHDHKASSGSSHGGADLRVTPRLGLPSNGPLWHTLREDRAPPLPLGRSHTLQQVVTACMLQRADARPSAEQILGVREVLDTQEDVDAVLLCAPRHADATRAPFLARSASMQGIDLPGPLPQGAGIAGTSAVPGNGLGLSINVTGDNQIDYAALGDGAFTPVFSHSHYGSHSPR